MSLFTPSQIHLTSAKPASEINQLLASWEGNSPHPAVNFLPGDLQDHAFELKWIPPSPKATSLTVEGKIEEDLAGSIIHLQVMLMPAQQASRLIWLGFLGLLFFVTLFGPPPYWMSIFPLGAMIMLYVNHESRFSTSERNLRAFLCEAFAATLEKA